MENKECYRCHEIKPVNEYYKRTKSKDGLNIYCKTCCKEKKQEFAIRHKEKYGVAPHTRYLRENPDKVPAMKAAWKKAKAENIKRKIQDLREWVNEIKASSPCLDCGGTFPPICMDFDHTEDNKTAGIAQLVSNRATKERILEEMAKCDIICANCHRIRTYARKQFGPKRAVNGV